MSLTDIQRAELEQAIASSLPAVADDPEALRVIAEARQNLAREQARRYIRGRELLDVLGLKSLDEVDRYLSELCLAGFPYRHDGSSFVQRILSRNKHGETTADIVAERIVIERWLEALDAVARRMGYTKKIR